ncbi:hypothetical protein SAMN05428948_0574 [Massilia sp. CF038]|nr:hypothetical protein SAMN05428948_0574 [Massilia sp. CF038]
MGPRLREDDVTNIKYPMLLDSIRTQLDSLSKSERKVALGCRKTAAHHIALAKAGAHSTLINFGSVEWVPAFARTM